MANVGFHTDEERRIRSQKEAVGPTFGSQQSASRTGSRWEQRSIKPGTDEVEQSAPVSFHPPAPVARPEPTIVRTRTIHMSSGQSEYIEKTEVGPAIYCARSPRNKNRWKEVAEAPAGTLPSGEDPSLEASITRKAKRQYIVVGIVGKEESIPHETLLFVEKREDLFKQIRNAEGRLRHPLRRLLSLKRVGAFGLYRCHPSQDYHSNPDISNETKRCLAELYRNYRTESRDYQDRWVTWIDANFNNGSDKPEDGTYALQLLLQWSPIKLTIWSLIPIMLSLAIGLWYMINPYPGEDHVTVVQTAWTIASYIVTTAALALAIVAAITQFGDS